MTEPICEHGVDHRYCEICHTPDAPNYERVSHTHCWNNQPSPCGIPIEKHTQCCLCDLKVPVSEPKKHSGETHICCSARFEKEGGQARCCYCVPHEGCELPALPTVPTYQQGGSSITVHMEKELTNDFATPPTPPTEGWKDKLGDFAIINELYLHGVNVTKLSAFIESLLAEQKARMVEALEGMKTETTWMKDSPYSYKVRAIDEAITIIKALSK